ncbi:uncharacterized protein [Procambarus clarkii]|uniref:uncharacterized protein n=1 Tax=Procambarus clarkii TaxID=6728 RepID=UPI003743E2C3
MTGQWEDVLREIIDLARYFEPKNNINLSALESTTLKPWILKIFTDPEMCPNPYLRLKMVYLISIWPKNFLQDATSGMQAAFGLVINRKYMDVAHLMPEGDHIQILSSIMDILISLDEYGHLAAIGTAAVDQIKGIIVGPEVSLLYNLVQVFKQVAEESLNLNEQEGLYMAKNVFYLYTVFLNIRKLRKAYGAPGLVKVAADTLVTITVSIVTISLALHDNDGSKYNMLVSYLDHCYNCYKDICKNKIFRSLSQVLRLDHAQYLSSLSKKAADSGIFFHHFPIQSQESSEEVPKEFRDSVTQAVMEAPVLLHSSKMVIDESTLFRLLLESPMDPFTRCPLDHGSYSRLPELLADILAWKKNTKVLV